jgi:hypothetical protein
VAEPPRPEPHTVPAPEHEKPTVLAPLMALRR